jgi:hypothetical protein
MRPFFALIVVLTTLGSVALYCYFVETLPARPSSEDVLLVAEGKFNVEITLTFDANADTAFVIDPTSVLVSLEGRNLINSSEAFTAGRPVIAEDVAAVKVGPNEFWVEVHAGDAADEGRDSFSIGLDETAGEEKVAVARAVRVRILRDGIPIAEQTLWSEPGEPVEGKVSVVVPADEIPSHDH